MKDDAESYLIGAIDRWIQGMPVWNKVQTQGCLKPRTGPHYEVDSPEVQDALKRLESKQVIEFVGRDDLYFKICPEYRRRMCD